MSKSWLSFLGGRKNNPTYHRSSRRLQLELLEDRRVPTIGGLDPTFGTGGRAIADFGASVSVTSVEVQADGKIVAAGAKGSDIALARFNSNGSLDTSFGTGGMVVTDLGSSEYPADMKVLADGKIVIAGSKSATYDNCLLVRYNANGSLDTSFGTGGYVLSNLTQFNNVFQALAITPTGNIVAGGYGRGSTTTSTDFLIAQYTAAGVLDTTFGSGGKVTTSFFNVPQTDEVYSLAVQTDGKIVAAGRAKNTDSFNSDFFDAASARYTPTGALDTTFGVGGKVTLDFQQGEDAFESIALQGDGKIVAAGWAWLNSGSTETGTIVRYNTNGTLDTTFGSSGKVLSTVNEEHNAVLVQGNGQILTSFTKVARYNADGTVDTAFGTNGAAAEPSEDLTLQADGKILSAISVNGKMTVSRLSVEGGPHVASFGPVSPLARTTPVDSVNITFTEPIAANTFNASDVSLTRNGTAVTTTSLTVSLVSGSTYRVGGLTELSKLTGAYVLSVNLAGITDTGNTAGVGSTSTNWTMTEPVAKVLSVGPVSPATRSNSVASIAVKLDRDIDPTSFTFADIKLSRDGLPVALPAFNKVNRTGVGTYSIDSFSKYTEARGVYKLTVSGAGLKNLSGAAGTGSASVTWTNTGVLSATLASKTLTIDGTLKDDSVVVQQIGGKLSVSGLKIKSGSSLLANVAATAVTKIVINTYAGEDDIRIQGKAFSRTNDDITITTVINSGSEHDFIRGGAGKDTINGGDGPDTIEAGKGNDTVNGGAGNDTLRGEDGDDTLNGDAGADTIFGGLGKDKINGGTENDTLSGEDNNDTIHGNDGNDTVDGGEGDDTLFGDNGDDAVLGFGGKDHLFGNKGADTLKGGKDNDNLSGGSENDKLYGDAGDDVLLGDAGNDFLDGGSENDTLWGLDGDDTLYGQAGNDKLEGGAGNDLLLGHNGNDTLKGEAGNDELRGGPDNDTLRGGIDDDSLQGQGGNDDLDGEAGKDSLSGSVGVDKLIGILGTDTLDGGGDNDSLTMHLSFDILMQNKIAAPIDPTPYATRTAGNDTFFIKLDLGSFGTKILAPIVEQAKSFVLKLKPLADFLGKKVPVVSDYKPFKGITFLGLLKNVVGKNDYKNLQTFVSVVKAAESLNVETFTQTIDLGSFTVKSFNDPDIKPSKPLIDIPVINTLRAKLEKAGITLPIFNHTSEVVKAILGQTVDLVVYTMPQVKVDLSKTFATFAVAGIPKVASIDVSLLGDLAFRAGGTIGYDTTGFQTGKVQDGLFVKKLFASIDVGLSLEGGVNLAVVKGGAGGRVGTKVTVKIGGSSKVYFDQFISAVQNLDPRITIDYKLYLFWTLIGQKKQTKNLYEGSTVVR